VADKISALHQSDALIFSSEFARMRTAEMYDVGCRLVLVAPYAIDPRFAQVPDQTSLQELRQLISDGRPFLMHVGSRYMHKNVPRLLQAFSGWSQRTGFALVLAGGGPIQANELQLIKSLGIEDDVFVIPRMSDDQLLHAYHAATAFVFPSLSEGFGFPVLEALACGCPTACSNAASLPEVGGSAPVYFDPMEIDSIRSALSQVIGLVDDCDRWSNARERANKRNWHDVAGEYLSFYRKVLAEGRSFGATAGAKH
jgi:glycosyltransferase involved in cell wall biosynthesis